jgi:hypothetical protein
MKRFVYRVLDFLDQNAGSFFVVVFGLAVLGLAIVADQYRIEPVLKTTAVALAAVFIAIGIAVANSRLKYALFRKLESEEYTRRCHDEARLDEEARIAHEEAEHLLPTSGSCEDRPNEETWRIIKRRFTGNSPN